MLNFLNRWSSSEYQLFTYTWDAPAFVDVQTHKFLSCCFIHWIKGLDCLRVKATAAKHLHFCYGLLLLLTSCSRLDFLIFTLQINSYLFWPRERPVICQLLLCQSCLRFFSLALSLSWVLVSERICYLVGTRLASSLQKKKVL